MAKSKQEGQSFDPAATYRIKLSRAVRVGTTRVLRPQRDDIVVQGWLAAEIADAIISSERV